MSIQYDRTVLTSKEDDQDYYRERSMIYFINFYCKVEDVYFDIVDVYWCKRVK